MNILIPVSVGELLDKLTILSIKLSRISDPEKKKNVQREFDKLKIIADDLPTPVGLDSLYKQLHQINSGLWDIEIGKRECERTKNFGDEFIDLARRVYIQNDERARIKREINMLMNSDIIEEKQHY